MYLLDHIKREIKDAGGAITFYDFMKIALYHNELGYYVKAPLRIGKGGDFITSPHTHSLFGALIARQLLDFRDFINNTETFSIVEMGSGSGYLAKDILSYLKKYRKDFYDIVSYIIIEPIDSLRNIQKTLLNEFQDKVVWVNNIYDIDNFNGCVISNELLDAFPVHLIKKVDNSFFELYVVLDDHNNLTFDKGDISSTQLDNYISLLYDILPDNYQTEINLDIKNWLIDINNRMDKGFILTIDYGYIWKDFFHPNRNRGTLLSYRQHQVTEDVLANPGEQDITAHVNFSDLHRWGQDLNFMTCGFTSQWSFLASLDVEEVFKDITGEFNPFSPELAAVKMLFLPQGMGDSHKVIVQSKNVELHRNVKGFSLRNIQDRLDIK